jgi:phospholipid/cholesterol/gamma-HCH transport system substrate-binding protein
VLGTQLDQAQYLQAFTASLDQLSGQLKASDADIRSLIDTGPSALATIASFIQDNRTDLGVLLSNLASTSQLIVKHIKGAEEVFELYPALAASALTVVTPDGTGRLGLALNAVNDANTPSPYNHATSTNPVGDPNNPPDCGWPNLGREGYGGTTVRDPGNLSPQKPNTAARCATTNPYVSIRGSQHIAAPITTAGGTIAYPRTTTTDTLTVGTTGNTGTGLGDAGWLAMLTNGLQ